MSGKAKTSDVWYHFEKNDKRAKCRYCQTNLSISSGSSSNLKRHLKSKHPTIPLHREERQPRSRSPLTIDPVVATSNIASTPVSSSCGSSSSTGAPEPEHSASTHLLSPPASTGLLTTTSPRSSLSPMSRFVDIIRPVSSSKKRNIDIQLLKMICKEYHPFSIVDDNEFKKIVEMLNPGYKLPSRKTLTNSLLPIVCSDLLEKVKAMVNNAKALSVTCDGWTNINNVSFYALTAHFFDDHSGLQTCLLECSEFSESHTASNIATWIDQVLKKYSIGYKVCAVVTDNAANIKAAVQELNLRHIPCYAHSLNLIVQSSITASISDVVGKVKLLVQFFKKSSSALAKLTDMQVSLNKEKLKLKQDVSTRWNSTYDMLERVLKNKEPLISTLALLGNTTVGNLSQEEWGIVQHAVQLLEVFNDVTKEISAETNVTLSKTTVLSRLMSKKVKHYLVSNTQLPEKIKLLCKSLLEGLSKRFGDRESHDLIAQSTILDPRFKSKAFGDENKYKSAYYDLIRKVKVAIQAHASGEVETRVEPLPNTPSSSIWDEFDEAVSHLRGKQDPTAEATVEIDKYLNEPYLPRTSDPLKWWEARKYTYPNVHSMVLKRLCIPATSVPCERVFSKAGQIYTDRRNRLHSDKMGKILFINNNLHLI